MKDILKKAAGLFVELPESSGPESSPFADLETSRKPAPAAAPALEPEQPPLKTVEQVVKDAPGPNLDEIKVQPEKVVAAAPNGKINYAEVYASAGIPTSTFPAEKALEMLGALPADLPLDARRQAVRVTMAAMGASMGVTPETVVADASRKIAALSSYSDVLENRTTEFVAGTQLEINQLERAIADKRAMIDDTKRMLEGAMTTLQQEADRLDDVLEFFTLDVPPSKNA